MWGKKILKLSTIAIPFTVLLFTLFTALPMLQVSADGCTVTLSSGANIQTAVDDAGEGDVICLDGTFHQSVSIGPEDTPITLSGSSGVLDGSGSADTGTFLTPNWAILLQDGVSNVIIENLEIKNYAGLGGGGQGNAIQAWDVSTSNIIVRNNDMHNNGWNGVLVGSEGGNGKIHSNWMVRNNDVRDNDFVGIELTNCNSCGIMKNDVGGSFLGIVVQARNTITETGQVAINGVRVLHNTVDSSLIGIYVLSYTGITGFPFSPINEASTLLTSVSISHNTLTDNTSSQIRFWAFNEAATAENGRIIKNVVDCDSSKGIEVLESGVGQTGTVKNVKVVNNKIGGDCSPPITNQGEATKLPPGGPFP